MPTKIKKIGVLTSGGDSPGMNAAIRAVVRTCAFHNIECIGIYRGYQGMIEGDFKEMGPRSVNNIVNKGRLINLTIFGNPFTAVGDIVSVKYSYQGLDGTQKFIVTNVRHTFSDGLDTEITCRSL
jgi:hypothetical protein